LNNHAVNQRFIHRLGSVTAVKDVGYQRSDALLRDVVAFIDGRNTGLRHDLVKQLGGGPGNVSAGLFFSSRHNVSLTVVALFFWLNDIKLFEQLLTGIRTGKQILQTVTE